MRSQRGVTLVEMLVLMATPAAALGGGYQSSLPQSPASIVRSPNECASSISNTAKQPMVVIAAPSRFGFETDCVDEAPAEKLVSYSPFASPGDSIQTVADTAVFFFQADQTTPRTDDFVLMRQMNNERPTPIRRNILPYPGRPFFQYYYRKPMEGGKSSTQPVPSSWLPLRHAVIKHGSPADTGVVARIDTLRAVEINYRETNGRIGPGERIYPFSTVIALADLKRKRSPLCEREPLANQVSNTLRNSVLVVPATTGACVYT